MALDALKFILNEAGPEKIVVVFPGGGMSIQPSAPGTAYVMGPGFSHFVKLTAEELAALQAEKTFMEVRAAEQPAPEVAPVEEGIPAAQ